jgi:hypothetical protein
MRTKTVKIRKNKTLRKTTAKRRSVKTHRKVFKLADYHSGDGMLTSVWGPSLWHYLHTMSFNYPVSPTQEQKHQYRDFMLSLVNVLPCRYCRENLKRNYKQMPLLMSHMESRETFSRYIYELHELVNRMLGKRSGLTYCDVRERYEHFRARCVIDLDAEPVSATASAPAPASASASASSAKKETGCTEPLYGKKAKCVIRIVPFEEKEETLTVDKRCLKVRGNGDQ